jgi:hypothetical protein
MGHVNQVPNLTPPGVRQYPEQPSGGRLVTRHRLLTAGMVHVNRSLRLGRAQHLLPREGALHGGNPRGGAADLLRRQRAAARVRGAHRPVAGEAALPLPPDPRQGCLTLGESGYFRL